MKSYCIIFVSIFCSAQLAAQLKSDTLILKNNTNLVIVDEDRIPKTNIIFEDSLINCLVIDNLKRLSFRIHSNSPSFEELFIEKVDNNIYVGSSNGIELTDYLITYDKFKVNSLKEIKTDSGSTLKINFENTKIKEIYKVSHDDFDDFFIEFYNGKSIKSVGNFKNGCKVGEWRTYYTNGMLHEIGNYCDCLILKVINERKLIIVNKEGVDAKDKFSEFVIDERLKINDHAYHLKDGTWSYYNENGSLNYTEEYKRGKKTR